MAANYRQIGGLENRLGRHYSRFSASGPAAPLAAQSLARRKSPNHGSNRRSQVNGARAEQPPSPCHPNPNAAADEATVRSRGDVVNLPDPLKDRLAQLANRPHTYLPLQVFAEADPVKQGASQLFQYYLLDTTGFQPNVTQCLYHHISRGE